MKRTLFIIFLVLIVFGISIYLSSFFSTDIDITPSDKSNVIVITSPIKDSEITSPLSVAGRARGSWFFEGSFPIVLTDSYGNVIAESHATAQGEWATDEFVKFVGSLEFNNYIKGASGKIILKKDNQSMLPENNDSIEIPIIFK